ncbi:MAG: citrate lyase subunit alpha [Candidatus Izemoplasmatales bacterium]|nr:citrate lyase subunit alpha [Candidatus Izemoplasmatales bacterium]
MINSLGRNVPKGETPFKSSNEFLNHKRKLIFKKNITKKVEFFSSIEEAFDYFNLKSDMTFSFHHHLRNGDDVINLVCKEIEKRDLKNLHFAPSSIFPTYKEMVPCIKNGNITCIHTSYLNGEVASTIQQGFLKGTLVMQTHGGRARSIESGELKIDVAFLATPSVDKLGNGTGEIGKSACGTLGYGVSDLEYAKVVLLVTDNVVSSLERYQFDSKYVDGVIVIDKIGNPEGIVSGTTKITRDPIGLKIAKDTANLLDKLGMIHDGFSMQTGAGGTSLAVANYVRDIMISKNIKGSFASGGITAYYVNMLEEGLFQKLYDVQCFDLEAVTSYKNNSNHIAISASKYGNPYEEDPVCNMLDFIILGATEIDLNFNVNVTTDSFGNIIGGSGGHSDIAYGSKVTVVVSQLIKSRLPIIKEELMTISTPGEDIDIFVSERGIAINPKRTDLLEKLKNTTLPVYTMKELLDITYSITGVPAKIKHSDKVVGIVEYRDGSVIDTLYQVG